MSDYESLDIPPARLSQETLDIISKYEAKVMLFIKTYNLWSDAYDDRVTAIHCEQMYFGIIRGNGITSTEEQRIKLARWAYERYLKMKVVQQEIRNDVKNIVLGKNPDSMKWYFITVGYDDKTITHTQINQYSRKLSEKNYFSDVRFVNEKFRKDKDGKIYVHHHTHFLVVCDLPKSKIIDRVYACVKKVVSSKNFVDVKGYKDNCGSYQNKLDYINGNKLSEKMECVEMDRKWRLENNII